MDVRFTVNGHGTTADGHGTAVAAIRDELGMTGTKLACGTGSCGACVVQVDGVPVAGCLMPATQLEGRDVTTIEGIGDGDLHPVQRAFVAFDALQCGFCTPGFVVESVAFFDRWRAAHGLRAPERDEVGRALAGHLCRCGAYQGIVAAVQAACAGEFDHVDPVPARVDAERKVRGTARYTVDVVLDGMLHGVVVRSTEAHADVTRLDPGPALAIPGVCAFVELLAPDRRVRYVGQELGAIAATDLETARRAARMVDVAYQRRGAVVGIDDAEADDAPLLAGGGWTPANSAESSTLMPARRRGNVRGPSSLGSAGRYRARRAVARAADRGDVVVDSTLTLPAQAHTTLEPHACVAAWEAPDRLRVYASTQMVAATADQIAKRFGLEVGSVVIEVDAIGGGFGSKQGMQTETIAAVELSRAADAPVKVVFDRSEELAVGGYRPGGRLATSLAGTRSGELTGIVVEARVDGGASAGQIVTPFLRFVYRGVPRSLLDYDVMTNAPPGKPFRAPGGPLAFAALESAIDEYSARIDMDPVAVRRPWKPGPVRSKVYDWVEGRDLWRSRDGTGTGRLRRGVGVAFGSWPFFFEPDTRVRVSSGPGGFAIENATQDIGNGVRSVLARAVAGELGVDPGEIDVRIGDSSFPVGPAAGGSRSTASVWPAAALAGSRLRERLIEQAASELGMPGVEVVPGGLTHAGELVPWSDVLSRLEPMEIEVRRPRDPGRPLLPMAIDRLQAGRGLSHSAHIVEVEVDTRFGSIRVVRVEGVLAAGTIHAPELARSQGYGAIVQGLGYGLYEERLLDPGSGVNVTSTLDDYRIMGIADVPTMTIDFIEGGFEQAGGGGIGLAELAITSVPAALINAVGHATGHWPRELPIRPDRMLEVLV